MGRIYNECKVCFPQNRVANKSHSSATAAADKLVILIIQYLYTS